MDERVKRIIGDGPYQFNTNELEDDCSIDAFLGQGMIVVKTKDCINISKGSHSHASYEFIIPLLSNTPCAGVETRVFNLEKDKLFPINSEQSHGPGKDILGCNMLVFQIDKDTLNDISFSMCKKNNIMFKNECAEIGNEIFGLLKMFMVETRNFQSGSDFILQNIINLIAINVLRQLKSNIPKLITEYNYCERENINRAISYLREEYNNSFSLEDVARIANLSPYHFIRTFKAMTGKTPYNYLLDVKIEKSKILLKTKNITITDICFRCGFNNLEHFSSVFKRKVGILPSQYRKL